MLKSQNLFLLGAFTIVLVSCGESSSNSSPGTGGTSSGGSAGASGSAGAAGAAGGSGGSVGAAGSAGSAGSGGVAGSGGTPGWTLPACSSVKGTWAVRFTSDDGATVSPGDGSLSGVAYTWGLAALDIPNVLVAEHAGRILRSEDAGCTYKDIGAAPASNTHLHAAPGGRAYGYAHNYNQMYLVQGNLVKVLKGPTGSIIGMGTSKADGAILRVADTDGQLWESKNEGATFDPIGVVAPKKCFYTVAFDPNDLDHAVCGTITDGTFVTFDGAKTWIESSGDAQYANTFSAVVSPLESKVVWIEGFQLGWHDGQEIGPEGRRIWRSEDGGKTFAVALEAEKTKAVLYNGNLLAAHPADSSVLYFTFGTPPIGGLSSESYLYRLDSTGVVVEHKQSGIDSYDAVVFSPASPKTIYLGVSSERP